MSPWTEKMECNCLFVTTAVFKFPMKILDFMSSGDVELVALETLTPEISRGCRLQDATTEELGEGVVMVGSIERMVLDKSVG